MKARAVCNRRAWGFPTLYKQAEGDQSNVLGTSQPAGVRDTVCKAAGASAGWPISREPPAETRRSFRLKTHFDSEPVTLERGGGDEARSRGR